MGKSDAGDYLFLLGWTTPAKLRHSIGRIIIVFHDDRITLPCLKRDLSGSFNCTLVSPVVDDLLSVYPESDTIVRPGIEPVGLGVLWCNIPGPSY